MKNFGLIALIATILIIVGGVFLVSKGGNSTPQGSPPPLPNKLEYFWGEGCPHCEIVQEFLDSWENTDKLNIDKREVWYNKTNANLMTARVIQCGMDPKKAGVPFMFTPEGECINGDEPIINYFKKINFEVSVESKLSPTP